MIANNSLPIDQLCAQLDEIVLIDPHSHINPHAAASKNLGDILGYHYFTELAHSAGMPREVIEAPGITAKEKVGRIVEGLAHLDNTIQVKWLIELCERFFGFQDDRLTPDNWEALYDHSEKLMSAPDWEQTVLQKSHLEAVFLTNDFDDPLTGFDTRKYIPCLRTDDLVFHLQKPEVRQRLAKATGFDCATPAKLIHAIGQLFTHFVSRGAKACAISLPPDFEPTPVSHVDAEGPLRAAYAGQVLTTEQSQVLSRFVFWTIAEFCSEHHLPFDLMIGVNRRVYESGVYQGQDLFDQRVSLYQYRRLFNAFPRVKFPISVLAHASNMELVSYAWIFPNVIANGHWWYSNIPAFIEPDCRSRLEAIPRNKNIGYYSDMYKLEFGWPKFQMYRRVLAKVLFEDFVVGRHWSEERAVELGRQILRGNVETIFSGAC